MASGLVKKGVVSHYGAVIRDSTYMPWVQGLLQRQSVEDSTIAILKDPKTNEELCIIGTCNLSTRLAYRNKQLIEQFNPTSVLVQGSESFRASSVGNFKSQEDFYRHLNKTGYIATLNSQMSTPMNLRNIFFEIRKTLVGYWLHNLLKTPTDWYKIFVPGLDTKFALDFAQNKNLPVFYGGEEFNKENYSAILQQKQLPSISTILRYHFTFPKSWRVEANDYGRLFSTVSMKDFSEQVANRDSLAWWTRFLQKLYPNIKKTLIDYRAEKFLYQIENKMKGERKLVLVNSWHVDQIEKLWRSRHGLAVVRPKTSGTEDMPKSAIVSYIKAMEKDRKKVQELTGSPMATKSYIITAYKDENRSHYA